MELDLEAVTDAFDVPDTPVRCRTRLSFEYLTVLAESEAEAYSRVQHVFAIGKLRLELHEPPRLSYFLP